MCPCLRMTLQAPHPPSTFVCALSLWSVSALAGPLCPGPHPRVHLQPLSAFVQSLAPVAWAFLKVFGALHSWAGDPSDSFVLWRGWVCPPGPRGAGCPHECLDSDRPPPSPALDWPAMPLSLALLEEVVTVTHLRSPAEAENSLRQMFHFELPV